MTKLSKKEAMEIYKSGVMAPREESSSLELHTCEIHGAYNRINGTCPGCKKGVGEQE